MSSEYWLVAPDDPQVRAVQELYPEWDAVLRAAGFTPVGAIRAWISMEPPDPAGLTGVQLRHAVLMTQLAEGTAVEVCYAHAEGRILASLADCAGPPEVILNSVLSNGAMVRAMLLDDELHDMLDCMEGQTFSSWTEGGMYQGRLDTGSLADLLRLHDELLTQACTDQNSPFYPLRTLDDALLARRLGGRMAARHGFAWGLDQSGVWDSFQQTTDQLAELDRVRAEAPLFARVLLWFPRLLLSRTIAWQQRAREHMKAGIGELLDVRTLQALPTEPTLRSDTLGSWPTPDQTPYPPAWWMRLFGAQ